MCRAEGNRQIERPEQAIPAGNVLCLCLCPFQSPEVSLNHLLHCVSQIPENMFPNPYSPSTVPLGPGRSSQGQGEGIWLPQQDYQRLCELAGIPSTAAAQLAGTQLLVRPW